MFFFQNCVDTCRSLQFRYGGIVSGLYCYCSHQINKEGKTTGCTSSCTGDLNTYCGGSSRMSAFEVHPPPYQNGIGKDPFTPTKPVAKKDIICE